MAKSSFTLLMVIILGVALTLVHLRAPQVGTSPTAAALARQNYGRLPLSFEPNQGQVDPRVKYVSRGNGATLFLTSTEAVLALTRLHPPLAQEFAQGALKFGRSYSAQTLIETGRNTRVEGLVLKMRFEGSNPAARIEGIGRLAGTSNYLMGNNCNKWRTGIPSYAKVRYRNLYPGIDAVYYGNQRRLEYDLVAAPGSDPGIVRLRFDGVDSLEINPAGDVLLRTGAAQVVLNKPVVYQYAGGVRRVIAASYRRLGRSSIGFDVARYDHSRPLAIDPALSYSTYLGGFFVQSLAIAVDVHHDAYVAGWTGFFSDFPTTAGAFQTTLHSGPFPSIDAFVAKLNHAGTALEYSTYLGGSALDEATGIAVDGGGNAYVTGLTFSADFPTTANVVKSSPGSPSFAGANAFVTKLNSAGSGLIYSTYLGGSVFDFGSGIAVDAAGFAYVAGSTFSPDFPTTPNGFQITNPSNGFFSEAFMSKLSPDAQTLKYSTYIASAFPSPGASGVAIDGATNAYVVGSAGPGLPATIPSYAGMSDGFVARIDTDAAGAASLKYLRYVGGSSDDVASAIAVPHECYSDCSAYITGNTLSTDFPATVGQKMTGGWWDSFVTKLDASGVLVYSRYLGGAFYDAGSAIAVDQEGRAYIAGVTHSVNFPTRRRIQGPGAPGGQLFAGSGSPPAFGLLNGWPGATAGTVRSMTLDPSTHTYYAGTDRTGVWKSTDGGASFAQTALTGAQVNDVQVFTLAFAQGSNTLYAAAAAGLFSSKDGGADFTRLMGIPAGLEVDFVSVDNNSPPKVFVGTGDGWFDSADAGAHFSAATGLPPHTAAFAGVVDEPDNTAFAATDKGVFRSTDSGVTFASTQLNFSPCYGMAIDNVTVPHIVYATCDAGIIASKDGFSTLTSGSIPAPGGGPFGVLVDSSAVGTPKPVFIGVQNVFFSQLYESTDGGTTFAVNGSLGSLADESIPVLLDPATTPETILVHDSWEHDATITKLNRHGSRLAFSTGLGGSNDETGTGIAIDEDDGVYVTGITLSSNFSTTPNAIQTSLGDGSPFGGLINGFVSKITLDDEEGDESDK